MYDSILILNSKLEKHIKDAIDFNNKLNYRITLCWISYDILFYFL